MYVFLEPGVVSYYAFLAMLKAFRRSDAMVAASNSTHSGKFQILDCSFLRENFITHPSALSF